MAEDCRVTTPTHSPFDAAKLLAEALRGGLQKRSKLSIGQSIVDEGQTSKDIPIQSEQRWKLEEQR